MNASEVIVKEAEYRAAHGLPEVRRAISESGAAVAGWSVTENRWIACAFIGEGGEWTSLELELLINGAPVPRDWQEVTR